MIEQFAPVIRDVEVVSRDPRDPVVVYSHPKNWKCIGVGNTAAVFQPGEQPELSIKVYADGFSHIAAEEAEIYRQLGESPFFPRFFGRCEGAIFIGYRPGVRVYDCLLQGIFIPEQVVHDVEAAMAYAREKGLNPSDIHSKNILVHEGRGFLIDVSDYLKNDECKRWDSLRGAYYQYYLTLYKPGLTIPSWVLEIIRKWYKANGDSHNIEEFAERIIKLFF